MCRAVLLLFFVGCSFFVSAEDIKFSAFGTLGLTMSNSDQYGYRANVGQEKGVFAGEVDLLANSLLGGQVEVTLPSNFDFVGQVVLSDLIDPSPSDYVSMAFLRYAPSAAWTFRAGRLSADLFMITEYRDINVAYSWANVPNEVYGMIPIKAFDGGDFTYSQRLNNGTVSAKLFGGVSEIIVSGGKTSNEFINIDGLLGGALIYDHFDWNIQGRYTTASVGSESQGASSLKPFIAQVPDFIWENKQDIYDDLSIKDHDLHYVSLSGQKYIDNWLLNFELAQISSSSSLVSTLLSGYISAAYQYNDHTFYSVLAKTDSKRYQFHESAQVELIPELVENIEKAMNFYSSNQSTTSIGWRWDITEKITSKFQLNITDIEANGATLWIEKGSSSSSETVVSLMYTLSFAL